MSTPRQERLARLFDAACDLAPEAQRELARRECGDDPGLEAELLQLLAEDAHGHPELESPAVAHVRPGAASALPESIGEFRILSVLGAGGMGVVYEAEQAMPRRRVALKVMRSLFSSDEERRRFEHEARALAWLNHPGIATVYAAGSADTGQGTHPYLAMELVRGERLDAHATRAGLGPRERLELLARVCDAVHHAHQKGVIHRDLKPCNVLVDESGQPKILDFGVARMTGPEVGATTRHTSTGEFLGTLPYMSPEQVRADPDLVDVRTDVYALGVIAYELLAGKRPLEVSSRELPEAIRAIVHDEPTGLGLLDRRLRGDIETIVHRALAKEKERRYGSASELAADIRRYLANEPILARRPSRAYLVRKFARRNRALVGGTLAVFVALLAGTITSTLLYLEKEDQREAASRRGQELADALETSELNLERAREAERLAGEEERKARTEAGVARDVTDYLVSLFEYSNPEAPASREITALEMLDRGVERIEGRLRDQPAVRARLLGVFGKINNWLQRYEKSRPILEEALALETELHGEDSLEVADTLERLAQVHLESGDQRTAESMHRRVLELRGQLLGKDDPLYSHALNNLSGSLQARGDFEGARALLEEVRALRLACCGEDDELVSFTDHNLGVLLLNMGRYEEACEPLRRAVVAFESRYGPDHWRTLSCHVALAEALRSLDVPQPAVPEALEHARIAYEGMSTLFGRESLMRTRALRAYASCLRDSGDLAGATRLIEGELAEVDPDSDPGPEHGALVLVLGTVQEEAGNLDEAEGLYLEAIERLRGHDGSYDNPFLTARHNLSVVYLREERFEEALPLELSVFQTRLRVLGPVHPDTRGSLNNLAEIYGGLGRTDDEERLRRLKLDTLSEARGPEFWATEKARDELASLMERTGRPEEAAALRSAQ